MSIYERRRSDPHSEHMVWLSGSTGMGFGVAPGWECRSAMEDVGTFSSVACGVAGSRRGVTSELGQRRISTPFISWMSNQLE